jgi:N-acetylmuramoyl-L-alanine amidase
MLLGLLLPFYRKTGYILQIQCHINGLINRNITFPEKYSFHYSKLIKSAKVRKFVSIFTVIILILFFQNQLFAQRKNLIRKVVIDAGHGGHDSGAKGKNSIEKDIALSIALKTGRLIQKNCPGVEVIYTRESDVFVELYRRAQIANENKADLFISIHCNANPSPFAYGTETYVMGLHKSEANLEVAQKENASILLEDNYAKRYDGFKPNSSEAYIVFNLFQNAYLDKSLDFASRVEANFTANTKLTERGVKQAGFLVLYRTTMPGVLVETGFLSNSHEEAYLMSSAGQERISYSIYRAFDEYRRVSDGNSLPVANAAEDSLMKSHPAIVKLKQEKLEEAIKGDTFGYRNNPKTEAETRKKFLSLIDKNSSKSRNQKEPESTKKAKQFQEIIKKEEVRDTFIVKNEPENRVLNSRFVPKSNVVVADRAELKFRVQFMINVKEIPFDRLNLKDIPNLKTYVQDQMFKYTAGDESTPLEADRVRQLLARKGYKDAFVLPFLNEKRITMKEALILLKNKQ